MKPSFAEVDRNLFKLRIGSANGVVMKRVSPAAKAWVYPDKPDVWSTVGITHRGHGMIQCMETSPLAPHCSFDQVSSTQGCEVDTTMFARKRSIGTGSTSFE